MRELKMAEINFNDETTTKDCNRQQLLWEMSSCVLDSWKYDLKLIRNFEY